MGNQQSNERKRNYKAYKITGIEKHSDWIRCYLDDYVPYSNGEHRYMDFETDTTLDVIEGVGSIFFNCNGPMQATLDEGRYIAIDTDMTKERSSSCNFSRRSVINVNVRNSSDSPWEGGFREFVEGIAEAREMRARASEWSDFDKQMQRAWQLQPPKK